MADHFTVVWDGSHGRGLPYFLGVEPDDDVADREAIRVRYWGRRYRGKTPTHDDGTRPNGARDVEERGDVHRSLSGADGEKDSGVRERSACAGG
jgi:hypothetical protein